MRLWAALLSSAAAGGVAAAALRLIPARRRRPARSNSPWLAQAGVDVTPWQFGFVSVALGFGCLLLLTLITGNLAVAAVPAVAVGLVPRFYFSSKRRKRMSRVRNAWPDGLRDLVASISAGRSLSRAIEDLAYHGPPALREALASFPFLSRSLGVVPALEAIRDDMADPTTDRVIEVLVVAHQRGGRIVPEILRDLADATARDLWANEESESAALELKINARAVFVLPWLVLIAMTARSGPFREFYQTSLGLAVIVVGGLMSGVGALIVGRLGRSQDEERVLGR